MDREDGVNRTGGKSLPALETVNDELIQGQSPVYELDGRTSPSSVTPPESEKDQRVPVLLISSGDNQSIPFSSHNFNITCRHVTSGKEFIESVSQFKTEVAKSSRAPEVWVIFAIPTTSTGMPANVDSVYEEKLLKPLHSEQDGQRTRVFCFPYPMGVQSTRNRADITDKCKPNRPFPCGTDFYRFKSGSNIDWKKLRDAFSDLEKAIEDGATGIDWAGKLAMFIDNRCGQLVQHIGIPSPKQAAIPSQDENLKELELLTSRLPRSIDESQRDPTQVLVAIVIGHYRGGEIRNGYKKDISNLEEIKQNLGCELEMFSRDGKVSYSYITKGIECIAKKYKNDNVRMLLAIAAHGSQYGIRTSDGKDLPIPEIVKLLVEFNPNMKVLLLYQACRGELKHPEWFACSLGFENPAYRNCCIPQDTPNIAAIYASMAGYTCTRTKRNGGRMLNALLEVLKGMKVSKCTYDISQLAELVQKRLQDNTSEGQSIPQIEFSINRGCENFNIEVVSK